MQDEAEKLAALSPERITLINTYRTRRSDYPMHNRGRYRHGLMYTLAGNEVYRFDGLDLSAKPGTLLYVPEGASYRITLETEESAVTVIDFTLPDGAIPQEGPFLVELKKRDALTPLFADAERLWNRRRTADGLLCKSVLYRILAAAVGDIETSDGSPESGKLRGSLEYLHAHCFEPDFRVDGLSRIAGLSQRYYNRLFTEKYSVAPKEYVTRIRMERAGELLRNEKLSVGEIADSLGYCDIYHFSRTFREKVGLSPLEYRKSSARRGE